ncbi:hypothetical protein B1813_19085 [Saccharomonospora piscinae]|uniref:DUF3558 domain-containing protein n=1 Tax=Saccharomonospora piscinae TaxID=687388 RepID=A0A1V8ZYS6_SACPI|nr:DUF3558 domain-containing protein [Saccharomonospora piscinae]OQO89946.1 hypothetical protein B1813_19085 [Saccharomonospora piscinae]
MHARVALAAATLAALAATLACTTRIAGIASPATTPPATAQPATTSTAAPAAETPLNLDAHRGTPCTSLTDAQAAHHLGDEVDKQPDPEGLAGPGCRWQSPPPGAFITVSYPHADDGLAVLHRYRDQFDTFEELQVSGYPAVAVSTSAVPDACTITIGASDTTHLAVHYAPSNTDLGGLTACQAGRRIASEVMANIETSR